MKDPKQFQDNPVMRLIRHLQTFRVDWSKVAQNNSPHEDVEYEPGIDREEANLEDANIVSSLRKALDLPTGTHALAIDLDIPAYLVPSSTPGHSHLYIDAKIPHHRYMALLSALSDAGIIEKGYADVSIARGHSDLRLPWIEKGDSTPERVEVADPPKALQVDDLSPF